MPIALANDHRRFRCFIGTENFIKIVDVEFVYEFRIAPDDLFFRKKFITNTTDSNACTGILNSKFFRKIGFGIENNIAAGSDIMCDSRNVLLRE